jgi:hypothetical protein
MLIPVHFTGNRALSVRVVTSAGAVVKEYRFSSMPQGSQTLSLSTGNLPIGVFYAVLSTGDSKAVRKIVVIR